MVDLKAKLEEQENVKSEVKKLYLQRAEEYNAVQEKIEDMYGKMSRADRQLKHALEKIGNADINKYQVSNWFHFQNPMFNDICFRKT